MGTAGIAISHTTEGASGDEAVSPVTSALALAGAASAPTDDCMLVSAVAGGTGFPSAIALEIVAARTQPLLTLTSPNQPAIAPKRFPPLAIRDAGWRGGGFRADAGDGDRDTVR
jgi:hypothetical protein